MRPLAYHRAEDFRRLAPDPTPSRMTSTPKDESCPVGIPNIESVTMNPAAATVPVPSPASLERSRIRGRWAPGILACIAIWTSCGLPSSLLAADSAPQAPSRESVATAGSAANSPSTLTLPTPGKSSRLPRAIRKPAPTSVDDLKSIQSRVKSVVARVSGAVVAVNVGGASGSAVVISADGAVLCAAHVCGAPGRSVIFTFPGGKTAKGKTLGLNHQMDSGLMQITDPGPWPFVPVGGPEPPEIGDWVVALGHPGGYDTHRSIVARLGRAIIVTTNLLQTDCTLLAGDSGGPLFDLSGRVIGIHSRISESTSENYHVPVATFLETWDRLAKGESWGEIRRPPFIGASGVDDVQGCRIDRILDNSPAARSGLRVGDIVRKVDDQQITSASRFRDILQAQRPGKDLTLEVLREEKEITLNLVLERGRGGGRGRPNLP